MLSRAGSDTATRLRRSKSASSVQQRRANPLVAAPIDPHTAQLHAIVAAHRAMKRSSERASGELTRWDSSASRESNTTAPRLQNIRFSASAEPHGQRPTFQSRTSNIASTLRIPIETNSADGYHISPPPGSEFGATENYGAEPSSYRRLHKARSMLTPRKRAISHQNLKYQSPLSTARTLRNTNSPLASEDHGIRLGLKRSMSFLRSHGQIFRRPQTEMEHCDEAIQMAREQYLRDVEHQQNRTTQFSSSFHLKPVRQQKGFRKSVRMNRTTNLGDGVKSDNQKDQEEKPESKLRSVSISLRDRVMKVFGRSLTNKESFPAQQLDASRPHFRDYVDGSDADTGFDTYHSGDPDSISRGSLYIPSQHHDESLEDLDKISATLHSAASGESLHSNIRSRATSWTNSTTTGSVAMRSNPLEKKRLSIIKEDGGPHQPSSSAGRHIGGVAAFAEPLRSQDSSGRFMAPVDSQRVYSALMKRIDREEAEMERTQAQLNIVHTLEQSSQDSLPYIAPTIRAVRSEASVRPIAADCSSRDFSMCASGLREQCMTPQQIAQQDDNIEKHRARLALHEAQSSFFPFSSENKPKTPSPFKLALAAQKEQQSTLTDESEGEGWTETGSVVVSKDSVAVNKVRSRFGMSDESLYSRTTNGGTNAFYRSPHISPDDSTEDFVRAGGMATIIPTRVNRHPRSTPSLQKLHKARSIERGEWKGWIKDQLIGLDRHASRASNRSHYRENAQIDGDDTSVGPGSALRSRLSQRNVNETTPTGPPSQRPLSVIKDRLPAIEFKEVSRNKTPAPRSSDGIIRSCSSILNTRVSVEKNDENKKFGGAVSSLRKISPRGLGTLLKSKRSHNLGKKEANRSEDGSPPISTPGRLQLQIAKARRSDAISNGLVDVTPIANRNRDEHPSQNGYAFEEFNGSQKDLSRLSRPFDMAVPEHNRPFDSMYLGKEDTGVLVGAGAGRLSVAPPQMLLGITDGVQQSLNKEENESEEKGEESSPRGDTALPRIVSGTAASGKPGFSAGMSLGSRRLVSNFLRSRRRGNTAGQSEGGASSPAGAFL